MYDMAVADENGRTLVKGFICFGIFGLLYALLKRIGSPDKVDGNNDDANGRKGKNRPFSE